MKLAIIATLLIISVNAFAEYECSTKIDEDGQTIMDCIEY